MAIGMSGAARGRDGRALSTFVALLALLALAASALAACAPHPGGDEIAFLRGGQLWAVYSDGTTATQLAAGGIVAFAWSPDHHQLVLRYGPHAAGPAAGSASAPDGLSDLAVTGVDGGSPVQITPQVAGIARSDAWWNANGNRLVYREGFPAEPGQEPASVVYVVSQADQPAGIARKPLLNVTLVPALAPDGSQVAAVDAAGSVRLGKPGAPGTVVASGALLTLPGEMRPARLLWRPHQPELLYATAGTNGGARLVLSTLSGRAETHLDLPSLRDYAFAPDGNSLLVQTADGLAVWPLHGSQFGAAPTMIWPEADASVLAWWSPTSRAVLVLDHAGYTLADVAARRVTPLLRASEGAALPDAAPSWHPLAGSPWNTSGDAIVFRDAGSGRWQGHALPRPHGASGLYVASTSSTNQLPTLIDSGDDLAPSWSYLDPAASWLTPS